MAEHASYSSKLSPSDRLMWNIERDPVLRSAVLAIGLLDRDPDWIAVRQTFERAVARVPRLRQRVARARFGQLEWVDDMAFSLDYHLRRVRAPHPGDLRTLLDLAAPDATAAFDPARPLWHCTIVEGLEGGRAAFVLKFHHTLTDGVGGIDLAGVVFDQSRNGGEATTLPEPLTVVDTETSSFDKAVDAAVGALQAVLRPQQTAKQALRMGRSIARMLAPAPKGMSPLFTTRGLDRRLDTVELPLADLRAAAAVTGCTINDLFLAAVGGAFHDFHERVGIALPAVRVTMPINVRTTTDGPAGNHFTPARFVLPIDDPDPAARARIAGAIAHRWQAEPAVKLTDVLAALLDRLPPAVVTRVFGSMLKNIDVDAVDLQGLQRPAFIGGAQIDRLWAFAPPTGAAVSITLLSHLDTACVAVLSDVAAVPDPAVLVTCLEGALANVRALAPHATAVKVAS